MLVMLAKLAIEFLRSNQPTEAIGTNQVTRLIMNKWSYRDIFSVPWQSNNTKAILLTHSTKALF